MDNQLSQWQKAFQSSTPQIDTEVLLQNIRKHHQKDRIKAWLDLLLGAGVSIFILYTIIFQAENSAFKFLLVALSPIPLVFGVWAFKLSHQREKITQLNVAQLLRLKQAQTYKTLRYWRVTAYIFTILWIALCVYSGLLMIKGEEASIWIIQVATQSCMFLFVHIRFWQVKKRHPKDLAMLQTLQKE